MKISLQDPLRFLRRWSRLKRTAAAQVHMASAPADSAAEEEQRQLAFRALFREPGIAPRDGLDDYDGDYTFFEPRGDLVTYDMLRAIERVAQGESTTPTETPPTDVPLVTTDAGAST